MSTNSYSFHTKILAARGFHSIILLGLFIFVLQPVCIYPQSPEPNIQHTSRASDQNLRSNLRVNPSTLAVEFELTLGNYPGRGGLSWPITFNYSSKVWRVAYRSYTPSVQNTFDGQMLEGYTTVAAGYGPGWTSSIGVPIILHDEDSSRYSQFGWPLPETADCDQGICKRIDRLMIRMPDYSVHELRSSDEPYNVSNFSNLPSPVPDDLYAVDGSGLRYQRSSQTLFLPDGSRYIIDNTSPRYIDRNGNTVTFTTDDPFNFQWNSNIGASDTLNRSLPPFRNPGDPNNTTSYSLPGFNGSPITYTLNWKHLGDAGVMSPGQSLHYIANFTSPGGPGQEPPVGGEPSLFLSDLAGRTFLDDPSLFNPVVLHQIVLPTGQAYTFNYNVYGELEKLTFPGGGYERYEYDILMPLSVSPYIYSQANRGVTRRFVSSSGNSADEVMWSYSFTGTFPYGTGTPGTYVLTTTAPDGSRIERYMHTDSLLGTFGFDVDQGKAGMAYEERQYSAPDATGTRQILWRNLTEWVTSNSNASNQIAQQSAKRNARVAKEVTIILDTGTTNALAKTTVRNYDLTYQFSIGPIETSVVEYDWIALTQTSAQTDAIGSIPNTAQPVRVTETTNLLLDTTIPQATRDAYRARHLVSLPSSTRIKNGSGAIVAQGSMKYDEYSLTTVGAVSGWTDPQTSVRGNLTTVGRWLNTTGTEVQAHTHYDQFGNVRTQTDAKGNTTQISYSSNHAYPTTTTTAVPDPSGEYGATTAFTTTTNYDVTTGLVVSTTDENGQMTTMSYNDPLLRLTQVTQPNGAHLNYTYSDSPSDLYIKVRGDQDATRAIETRTYFDGLGRTVRSFLYDGTPTSPWVVTDTYYDSFGRPFKASNPYRVASPGGTVPSSCSACTTNAYDTLGRVVSVTTPDNASITTSYGALTSGTPGTTVVMTDQAGKKRKTLTDALGRLIAVYEDPTNLNYVTTYTYDVLGNLTGVTQDSQSRTFTYDSLSRLRSAINPESGTILYEYDNNGNLTKKTDGRGVESVYAYDTLNRNITVNYSDTTTISPDVTTIYDGATNGKGRLWKSYKGGTESVGSNVEKTEVVSYDAMGRPLKQRQFFKLNATWNTAYYETSRTYNLAGKVISQTYPSDNTVTYSYDDAGRTNSFSGDLGDNNRIYSTGITYASGGQMTREQFGTNTAVFNKLRYNSRQQLAEILVNTTGADNFWNRGRIINDYSLQCSGVGCNATDNNGNLRKQIVYIPADDQASTSTSWYQQYDYDELNRLKRVHEYTGNSALDWQQEYLYDRWGNRRIDTNAAKTFGTGINNKDFEKDDGTNRLYAPGDLALPDSQRRIRYDSAGNQIKDLYTGYGTAIFDADNHITAIQDKDGGTAAYTYNADGQRTRRKIGTQETWQIYGFEGELLAEYPQSGATNAPQKEYGYRNGQLLITAEPGAPTGVGRVNVALAANGGVATASSSYADGVQFNFTPAGANNGNRSGAGWGSGEGWNDAAPGNTFSDWFQIDFNGSKTIDEIDVFTEQDNWWSPSEPTESMTFSTYGLTGYKVQYWDGSSWVTVTGSIVSGNNKVWRKFTFAPITTTKIQVLTNASVDGYSRITELEAWGYPASGSATIQWLVTDHLGTPRMVLDQTGSLGNVKRHDYLPFGEELHSQQGLRSAGYSGDGVRQQFTQKERDVETGLDYFEARYYSSTQGRFTGVDPGQEGARELDPQSWNGYAYTGGNPLNRIDPDGKKYLVCDPSGKNCQEVGDEDFYNARRNDSTNGFTYTGSRDFFENGQIKNSDGKVVNTYVQISIDTDTPAGEQRAKIFELRRQTAPIPSAVLAFFELSVELGTRSGLIGYRRTSAELEALNPSGAPQPIAAQKLGRLNGLNRADARGELTKSGFRTRGPSPGGNETWIHPDGSRVTIKSNGEVVRNPNAEAVRSRGLGEGRKGWEVDPSTGDVVRPHSVPREKVN